MPYRKKTEDEKPAPTRCFCVICQAEIPEERIVRKAVTCSKEHANDFKNLKRRLRDTEKCRLCNRPSSAEERADFNQWRKERREQASAKRRAEAEQQREEKKRQKALAKLTPIEEQLGTVAI